MVRLWGRSGLGQNSKRDAGERAGGQCVHERDRLLTNQMNRFGKLGRRSSVKSLLCAIIIAVVVVAMFQAPTPAAAQTLKTKPDLKGPTPRLPNGKPDFSGVWARPGTQDLTRTFTNRDGTSNKGEPNPLPFTPWGQAQWDNYDQVKYGDYAGSCMPFGWIRSFTPHPMQILQNNEYIAFLFEQSTMFQAVNTEGMPHRKDWPPTWFGDSRGHWEGDITPWTGPKDSDDNRLYGTQHDWPAYDLTKQQKVSGVLRELSYRGQPPVMKIETSDKKMLSVVIAPPPRMEFRMLSDDALKPGVTVSVVAYPSKQIKDEVRAETLTVGGKSFELR